MGGWWGESAACNRLAASWGCQEQVVPDPQVSRTAAREQGAPLPTCSVRFASIFVLFLVMAVTCCDPTRVARGPYLCRIELPSTSACPDARWGLFSPCLKNCMFSCSGLLPGRRMVDVGRRSLLSWAELAPRQHLHRASAPMGSVCLPTLLSRGGAGILPSTAGRGRCRYPAESRLLSCVSGLVCGQRSAVRFTAGSWHSQAALHLCVSTDASWLFILVSFLGSVFFFDTCWDEQGTHPVCAEQGCAGRRLLPMEVMEIFWQVSCCDNSTGKG